MKESWFLIFEQFSFFFGVHRAQSHRAERFVSRTGGKNQDHESVRGSLEIKSEENLTPLEENRLSIFLDVGGLLFFIPKFDFQEPKFVFIY